MGRSVSSDFWSHSLVRLKSTIRRSRPAFSSVVRALGAVKGAKRDRATRERSCENCRDWRPVGDNTLGVNACEAPRWTI
jgi:hypothetical protein